ncbi:hypothetical protein HanLR1_Chr07g0243381 [Helianthus annuus]|nr:hypothetical protein HanLR1_Chr07g0243381 [Helianthus annuus]
MLHIFFFFRVQQESADEAERNIFLVNYVDYAFDDLAVDKLQYILDHSDAKGLRNKQFPYYDELCFIFGKHRGNHRIVEDASDANRAVETYETGEYAGHMSK